MSIAVLGDLPPFEVTSDKVFTWQEAKRTAAARWATHEVYAGQPVKEFLGPGLAKIELSVRLDIERGVIPRDVLRTMRDRMNTGAVMQFTVGGELVGDFVIDQMSEDWKRFSRNGVLTTAQVGLSLEQYV